ncbi:MAG: hypothetical protein PF637_07045 [Spirochaetes bacterium]|jgi:poly(3-hydroxybutyrate) depolymerase|nr:hypothetical protein [Spirochaetota bacterium]
MATKTGLIKTISTAIALILIITAALIQTNRNTVSCELPETIKVGSLNRIKHGAFYLPKGYSASKLYPLIIVLHPMGATEDRLIRQFELDKIADKRGYILLAPRATKLVWEEDPDIKTILAMTNFMKNNFPIDQRRVLMTGFSSGGHFTLTMLLYNKTFFNRKQLFTAFAAGGGGAGYELGLMMERDETPEPQVPGYIYWGAKEPGVPGKEVSRYLIEQGWDIIAHEHDGYHYVPDGEFQTIFNWFDALEL